MKINKKVLGMIMGLTMVFGVGCNKNMDITEEIIKENIENIIERNIEEYNPQYDYLTENQQFDLDVAKIIDMDKTEVEIEELEDVYEIEINIRYKDGYDLENNIDTYVLNIDKDKFTKDILKDEKLFYDTNFANVVAHKMTNPTVNGDYSTWLYCVKGYEGFETNKYHNNKYDMVNIMDNWFLEKSFLSHLGDVKFDNY